MLFHADLNKALLNLILILVLIYGKPGVKSTVLMNRLESFFSRGNTLYSYG